MKWSDRRWKPYITCLNLPWPSANPRAVLSEWRKYNFTYKHWKQGKTWMILPDDRKPKGA